MPVERDEFRAVEQRTGKTENDVTRLQEKVLNMQNAIETLVTKAEFGPVKLIAYGLATLAMSSVVMAVLAKVIVK